MVSSLLIEILNTILKRPRATIIPIPIETTTSSAHCDIAPDVTCWTCLARTIRSGSAMFMKKPRIRPAIKSRGRLLFLVMDEPICWPMGWMARSAPNRNIPSPSIIKTAPTIKRQTSSLPIGAMV